METIPAEIIRPGDKPAWEWIRGRARQKVSPTWTHSQIQKAFSRLLDDWGAGQGESGIEVHLMVRLPGEEKQRPLVPDVCYYTHDRLRSLTGRDAEYPPIPPDITVEVKSPDDRLEDIQWKRERYRSWGVKMIIDVDIETDITIDGPAIYPDLVARMRELFDSLKRSKAQSSQQM